MKFFKTNFSGCLILNHLYFVLTFFCLLEPTTGHHIEYVMQKVNDIQFLRFLDLYYLLIYLNLYPTVYVYFNCLLYCRWSNGLVVKVLDSQSKSLVFKTTGWLQGRLNLLSFRGRSNEYQEFFLV